MKKFFGLCFDFIGSAKLNMILIVVICTVVWCTLAVMYGNYVYYTDSYNMFNDAGAADDIYFTAVVRSRAEIPKLREGILAVPGVTGIAEKPYSCRLPLSDDPDTDYATFLRFDEALYKKFTPRLIKGSGFDYSSDTLECIVTNKYKQPGVPNNVHVGDRLKFKYTDADGEIAEIVFNVVGIGAANRFYPVMDGGGSASETVSVLGQTSAILLKYSPLTSVSLDKVFGSPLEQRGADLYTAFVETEGNLSEKELDGIVEACDRFGSAALGSVILANTKTELDSNMKIYAPVFMFLSVFLITTIVCLITLSIYRYAESYTIWRILGGSRLRVVAVIFASYSVSVAVSLIMMNIILHIVISGSIVNFEIFSTCILDIKTTLPAYAAAFLTCAMAAAITNSMVKGHDLRLLNGKYKE